MAFTIPSVFTAIDRLTRPVRQMAAQVNSSMAAMQKKYKDVSEVSKKMMVNGAIVGAVIAAPLVMATKQAIAFEDQMADVAKTTGLSGKMLQNLGDSILKYSGQTRTSIQELTQIAAIGGSMGIASEQLDAFTKSADKFNIALGSDFGGVETAVKSVAALRNLFKETRGLEAADSINRVGSAINALTMKGAGAQSMNDIAQRLGALPDFLKPSIQDTIALAAVLDKAGISAEVAASGMTQLTSLGGREIASFAKQMKLSTTAATQLLNTDPSKFAFKLAESFRGMEGVKAIQTMDAMKIKSTEVMKIIGALGSNYDDFIKYQQISNNEFVNANSLSAEAAAKNATHAAKIEMLKNQATDLAIKFGELLLPVLDELLKIIQPIITSVTDWVKENPELASTITKVALGVAAFAFVMSGVGAVIQGVVIAIEALTAVVTFLSGPIGLIILAIAAMITLVVLIIKYYDEWGKYITLLMGPIGILIDLIMTVRKHWDAIGSAFKEGGIKEGIKAIGRALLDFLLSPIKRVLELIGKIPGAAALVQPALDMMNSWTAPQIIESQQTRFMRDMGLERQGTLPSFGAPKPISAVNPKAEQAKAVASSFEKTINNRLSIDINGNPKDFSYKAPKGIPVKLTPNIA